VGKLVPENGLVSFVVIAYNEARNIARTLASINAQEELGRYEVVVVDDGSRDRTAEIVAELAAQNSAVRLIRLTENRGRGYARARGVAEARGNLIATIDADIILPPDWLLRARAALHDHDAVGGTAVPDGDVAYIYHRFRLVPRCVGHTTPVSGSNALYHREVFDIAEFDPTLREGEDVALNHAIKVRGLSFVTVPGLLVSHEENKTFGQSLRWLFETGAGATRQLITYGEVRQPDLVTGAFVVTMTTGLYMAVRGRKIVGTVFPTGFILTASVQHVRSRFETPRSHWYKVVLAVATDCAMLSAYSAGRVVGIRALWKRPK
jgi:glycosyltransferase involved in cell wall biosynthesis